MSSSTVRSILQRRRRDVAELESVRRQRPRTIVVPARMLRWGIDLTLVWVLGVLPVWLVGVVDMHSSRLIALRPVTPTSSGVVAVLNELFLEHGRPVAVMTDNGGQFVAATFRTPCVLRVFVTSAFAPVTRGRTARPSATSAR